MGLLFTFEIGDTFPSEDVTAQFVFSMLAQVNDLVMLNRLLVDAPSGLLQLGENLYIIRASASHLYEAAEVLRLSERLDDVREFRDSLFEATRGTEEAWTVLRSLGKGSQSDDAEILRLIRNKATWHYLKPGFAEEGRFVREYLSESADENGTVEVGNQIRDFRAHFIDIMAMKMVTHNSPVRENGPSIDAFQKTTHRIATLIGLAVTLGIEVFNYYKSRHPTYFESQTWPPELSSGAPEQSEL